MNYALNIKILPVGTLGEAQVDGILGRHTNIRFTGDLPQRRIQRPCYVYPIFKRSSDVYGVNSKLKAGKSIKNIFNKYKKISRWQT
jgi:hypothetical protein